LWDENFVRNCLNESNRAWADKDWSLIDEDWFWVGENCFWANEEPTWKHKDWIWVDEKLAWWDKEKFHTKVYWASRRKLKKNRWKRNLMPATIKLVWFSSEREWNTT